MPLESDKAKHPARGVADGMATHRLKSQAKDWRKTMNTDTTTGTATGARFDCTCHGCRNYPTRPAEVWQARQIPDKERGTYYFTPSAMRFFSSRISDFMAVRMPGDEIDSLSVIVTSRHGYEGAGRYYEVVTLCPYGTIHRESAQFDSLRLARKSWNETLAGFAPCSCHGCTLNREGR